MDMDGDGAHGIGITIAILVAPQKGLYTLIS